MTAPRTHMLNYDRQTLMKVLHCHCVASTPPPPFESDMIKRPLSTPPPPFHRLLKCITIDEVSVMNDLSGGVTYMVGVFRCSEYDLNLSESVIIFHSVGHMAAVDMPPKRCLQMSY